MMLQVMNTSQMQNGQLKILHAGDVVMINIARGRSCEEVLFNTLIKRIVENNASRINQSKEREV